MFLKMGLRIIVILSILCFSSCSSSTEERFLGYMKGEYMIIGTTSFFIIDTRGCFQDQGVIFRKLISIQTTNQGIYSTFGVNEKFLPVLLSNGVLYQGSDADSINQINYESFKPYAQKIY